MSAVDLELKKHFEELQAQVVDTRVKMKQIDVQMDQQKKLITHSTITKSEITGLPEDVRTFESLGRMFVLRKKSEIEEMLHSKITSGSERIQSLESNKKYLETSLKERENSLRELVSQKLQRPK